MFIQCTFELLILCALKISFICVLIYAAHQTMAHTKLRTEQYVNEDQLGVAGSTNAANVLDIVWKSRDGALSST